MSKPMYCSVLLWARLKLLRPGKKIKIFVYKAARESLKFCYHVLQSRTTEPIAADTQSSGDMSSYSFGVGPDDEKDGLMSWEPSGFIDP